MESTRRLQSNPVAEKEPSLPKLFVALCAGVGVGGFFLTGLSAVLYQVIHWFRYGVWVPVSVGDAWERITYMPRFESSASISWLIESPLSACAFAASLLLYCASYPLIKPALSGTRER
jgi:hypothetical protein